NFIGLCDREIGLILQHKEQCGHAEFELLLLRIRSFLCKVARLARRFDMRAVQFNLVHCISYIESDLLSYGIHLRRCQLLCAGSAGVIGACWFVRERDLQAEAERISVVIETEEPAESIINAAGHNSDDCVSAQRRLQSLNAAKAVLRVRGINVEYWQ